MLELITPLLEPFLLIPGGFCFLWNSELMALHALSDALMALAFCTMAWIVFDVIRQRGDRSFAWIGWLVSAWLMAAGTTHGMEIWTLWQPNYWLFGGSKLVTAVLALLTGVVLGVNRDRLLTDPSQNFALGVQAVERAIHDFKQTEAALRRSEERLQLALEASGDGLWDWNIQADTIYYNPRYFEMLGYAADELPPTVSTWEQLIHPDDRVWVKEILAAHLKESSVSYKFDYRLKTKTGEWKWVADYGKVVARDAQGKPLRMLGTHRDVDDRKRTEQVLQEREAFLRAIGDNIPNGYLYQLMREPDGRYRFTYVSAGIERVSGLKPEAILADASLMFGLLHEDDVARVIQTGEESAQQLSVFDIQARERSANGEMRWLRLCSTPRRLDDGRVIWDGIRLDIHDLKQTEAALRQSEAKNRAMLAAIPDLLLRVKRDGTCLDFIPPTATEAGIFVPIEHHLSEILSPDLLQRELQCIERALATGELQVWEHRIWKRNELCDEEVRLIPCGEDEVLVIVRDVSDRKKAEEALRRYERIVSATTDAILLIDRNYVYQVVNQAYLNWYNKRPEEVVGHPVSEILTPVVFEQTLKPRLDECLAGKVIQFEWWMTYPILGPQFLSVTYDPYIDANQTITGVVVSLRNITRLKQAEMALELQSVIVSNMAEGVCMVRADDGIIVYANPKFEQMFGYGAGELKDRHVSIVNYEDEMVDAREVNRQITQDVMQYGEATYEVHNVKKNGTDFWCRATTSIFQHPEHGSVMVAVQQDITAQKQAAEQLQASLKEKEVLLKEIHHRVKNNLGIVDGLLQMQARRSHKAEVVAALKDSQNRIASIALVHEKLYRSVNLADIDFSYYIPDLIAHLFASYNVQAPHIQLITHLADISLDIETAIPCGLILNELVSNALKYAFPDGRTGILEVLFQLNSDQTLTLIVHDNGIGLPDDFNLKHTKTLGLSLIQGLVKQLRGTLEIGDAPGTTFRITFAIGKK